MRTEVAGIKQLAVELAFEIRDELTPSLPTIGLVFDSGDNEERSTVAHDSSFMPTGALKRAVFACSRYTRVVRSRGLQIWSVRAADSCSLQLSWSKSTLS